jgi:hypothetical protein
VLSTRNLISDIKRIPNYWVFSFYCNIPIERFNGTEFKISSVFNKKDTNPSMCFYITNGTYKFNDFSSGNKGDGWNFVEQYFKLSKSEAVSKILSDYNNWVLKNNGDLNITNFKEQSRFKVTKYIERKWSVNDKKFWTDFNISSKILEHYNVKPLDTYTMTKDNDELRIIGDYLYGYFTKNGELYKIYQPKIIDQKFIKVKNYIQGEDQIKKHPFLLYTSSLKDIMCIYSMGLRLDFKAPDSENTLLPRNEIENDLNNYKKVLILFDNDPPGVKAAHKYEDMYGIEPVFLSYGEKDPSDHVKTFGVKKVKEWLVPLIDKHLN